ncbi:MAG: DegV family protein, partial [Clostridia bacterium]|nr:DegV family protein [Clostridia bacterium]
NNGRVPVAVAKLAGVLSIRLIATAFAPGKEGTITPMGTARGEKRVIPELMKQLQNRGYKGGKVRLTHCDNSALAERMKEAILEKYPGVRVDINPTGMLCSFYAERGGLLVAFECEK